MNLTKRKFFLASTAEVVFESPDLNMGDVEKALTPAEVKFPAEFNALGPFFTDVKLVGRVAAKLDNRNLSFSVIVLEGTGQAGIDEFSMGASFAAVRSLCRKLNVIDEPTAWLLMPDLGKHGLLKWIAESDELTEAFRENKPFTRATSGPVVLRSKI